VCPSRRLRRPFRACAHVPMETYLSVARLTTTVLAFRVMAAESVLIRCDYCRDPAPQMGQLTADEDGAHWVLTALRRVNEPSAGEKSTRVPLAGHGLQPYKRVGAAAELYCRRCGRRPRVKVAKLEAMARQAALNSSSAGIPSIYVR
jgi:hypothetical protein